jgi:hypothetical protein
VNATDFIYTCVGHLSDPGFASEVKESGEATTNSVASTEEIAKVKEEWEKKQREKREAKKASEKDKEKPGEKEGKDESKGANVKTPGAWSESTVSNTPTSTKPSHQRYTLHRDYFAMRQAAHRRRRQVSQAKELAPRLPGAPRGVLDSA